MAASPKLLKQNRPLKQVSKSCGFSSISYFVCLFRQYYNCTPCEYAKHQLSSGK
nr:helix-turn-helix domain-containing protein [Escherichia fergusonii]